MPPPGVAPIVSFLETMLIITAGLVTLSKRFKSQVEFFLVFVLTAMVALFLCHIIFSFSYTKTATFKILKSKDPDFFSSGSPFRQKCLFLVGPAGFEPATKAL
jgi:formate hydrogenlyase subunit 3/multisubunit Na+/H+ antiporter MnhD subunit